MLRTSASILYHNLNGTRLFLHFLQNKCVGNSMAMLDFENWARHAILLDSVWYRAWTLAHRILRCLYPRPKKSHDFGHLIAVSDLWYRHCMTWQTGTNTTIQLHSCDLPPDGFFGLLFSLIIIRPFMIISSWKKKTKINKILLFTFRYIIILYYISGRTTYSSNDERPHCRSRAS